MLKGADAGEPGGPPDLALWFFQLPYLIDGSHKLTQSKAILRYIARKHNMCEWGWGWGQGYRCPGLGWEGILRVSLCCVATGGETEEEKIRMDVLENQAMDTANDLAILCYNPEFVSLLLLLWAGCALKGD